MLSNAQFAGLVMFVAVAIGVVVLVAPRSRARAQETTTVVEVAPYKFADLPHGRIYKAVHKGCELFIAEGSMRVSGSPDAGFFYTITTGRGCR